MAERRRSSAIGWLPLVVAIIGGCGERMATYPVSGTVTLRDGTPLARGSISMQSEELSLSAKALTDDQGRFTMTTFKLNDGLPKGTYRALVLPPIGPDPDRATPVPFKNKYMRYESSGLQFTIDGPVEKVQVRLE